MKFEIHRYVTSKDMMNKKKAKGKENSQLWRGWRKVVSDACTAQVQMNPQTFIWILKWRHACMHICMCSMCTHKHTHDTHTQIWSWVPTSPMAAKHNTAYCTWPTSSCPADIPRSSRQPCGSIIWGYRVHHGLREGLRYRSEPNLVSERHGELYEWSSLPGETIHTEKGKHSYRKLSLNKIRGCP